MDDVHLSAVVGARPIVAGHVHALPGRANAAAAWIAHVTANDGAGVVWAGAPDSVITSNTITANCTAGYPDLPYGGDKPTASNLNFSPGRLSPT
jgi:hypothetical protein